MPRNRQMNSWEEKQILFYNCILLTAGFIAFQIKAWGNIGKVSGALLISLSILNIIFVFIPKKQASVVKVASLSPRKLKKETAKSAKLNLTKTLKASVQSPKKKEPLTLENLDSLLKNDYKSNQDLKKVALADNLQKFQPATQYQVPVKVERIEDGFLYKNASATMQEFYSIAPLLDDWCEGIRGWMEKKIVSPLVKRIQFVDEAFEKAGISFLDCKSITMDSRSDPLISQNGQIFSQSRPEPGKPRSLLELYQAYPNEPMVVERMKLERFLTLSDYHCREYIVERIERLSGFCLAQFRWNSGQDWDKRVWNHEEFPSDAQLIMSLFIHYMDEVMGAELQKQFSDSFSSMYYIPFGSKADTVAAKRIYLKHGSKWPPHYQVVVDQVVYDLYPGRNNVFQAIALMAHCVRLKSGGYVGPLDLGSRVLGLLDVISTQI